MNTEKLTELVTGALEDLKGINIVCLDVRDISNVTDCMVIASGTSRRHVNSLAENVVAMAKKQSVMPLGTEGEAEGEWILVDLGDVLVNVMMPDTRLLYDLEKLWAPVFADKSQDEKV